MNTRGSSRPEGRDGPRFLVLGSPSGYLGFDHPRLPSVSPRSTLGQPQFAFHGFMTSSRLLFLNVHPIQKENVTLCNSGTTNTVSNPFI